uniref:neuronal acetylcholine receptor subunit alpha-3-like isoform X1 n=2 Tax=Myxine glutinosa TaxID=7769 RepID=UPI00359010D8
MGNCQWLMMLFTLESAALAGCWALEAEIRLHEDLFSKYISYIRPVTKVSDPVIVNFELSMSQLVKVDEVNQIMETNVWLKQMWNDSKLHWDPTKYGGIKYIKIPSTSIWKPDIVLYNNADGDFHVQERTKAMLRFDGSVLWMPPAIFKSSCKIDVTYFPFDYQNCTLKFGIWTHDMAQIDLRLVGSKINLEDFLENGEWVIIDVPGYKHEKKYNCCEEIFQDITYSVYIRRLPLFYTINLIIPCLLISFITVLVFYLPSDCGEKVTLCISVLLSLTVFLLVITESIPSTSLVIPLIGEYLLLTMLFMTLSITITIFVLNVRYRRPDTYSMPDWVRTVFLETLPSIMLLKRPKVKRSEENQSRSSGGSCRLSPDSLFTVSAGACTTPCLMDAHGRYNGQTQVENLLSDCNVESIDTLLALFVLSPEVQQIVDSVKCIAENLKKQDEANDVESDWKYVALVVDRIFLWVFAIACSLGTAGLFLQPLMAR